MYTRVFMYVCVHAHVHTCMFMCMRVCVSTKSSSYQQQHRILLCYPLLVAAPATCQAEEPAAFATQNLLWASTSTNGCFAALLVIVYFLYNFVLPSEIINCSRTKTISYSMKQFHGSSSNFCSDSPQP